MKKLIILLTIITMLSSCEIETSEPPCFIVQPIDWNMKCDPVIKVPILGALDYYEVKALLYNDSNESTLMKNVTVIQDTVILNAKGIDFTEYQNKEQYCEIYLVYYN